MAQKHSPAGPESQRSKEMPTTDASDVEFVATVTSPMAGPASAPAYGTTASSDSGAATAPHPAQDYIAAQKQAAAQQLGGLADAVRAAATRLQHGDSPTIAAVVNQAADGLDRLSGVVRERDLESLWGQAQEYARRRPAVVAGGALAAGFALTRFLRRDRPTTMAGSPMPSGGVQGDVGKGGN